ncbi:restriction endonuclease [Streptomyces mesophilus]|uniref:restriction endonuclease n=1 Tax=Streptomyces mesophilus TaxID=1775132 RepID=UPI003319732D
MLDLPRNEQLRRSLIHDKFGGNRQQGITPATKADNELMLFSSLKGSRLYGYIDDWGPDGHYHYTGEGLVGDQDMTGGNRNILNHRLDGRPIHVFRPVSPGVVQHLGQFTLAEEKPWYRADRPDRNGDMRSVITFRLRPVIEAGTPLAPAGPPHHVETTVEDVEVEQRNVSTARVRAQGEREAERRESLLVEKYLHHLRRRGISATRKKITLADERTVLRTDVYVAQENFLIEAKGTVTREAIRTAIGQLFDYQRYIHPRPTLGLLLPDQPRTDMLDLCAALSITAIWADGESFQEHKTST